ncbi:hypothetical protein SNEBB_006597 [Seison nebaliae]|nr:hypothetical protein SNEBB_006597 [Seison nebaliae]
MIKSKNYKHLTIMTEKFDEVKRVLHKNEKKKTEEMSPDSFGERRQLNMKKLIGILEKCESELEKEILNLSFLQQFSSDDEQFVNLSWRVIEERTMRKFDKMNLLMKICEIKLEK